MANRFWVGGTGTWDASDTTHWAATTGAAGGQSVPGSGDNATFDANSGGGTVTVNTTVALISLTAGAFTGTLDFGTNNNNVTVSGVPGVSWTGTGTRSINMGSGTWTFTNASAATIFDCGTVTNLTPTFQNAALVFSATMTGTRTFSGGGQTYGSLTVNSNTSRGPFGIGGANTFSSVTINSGVTLSLPQLVTQTITGALTMTGTTSLPVGLIVNTANIGTLSVGSASTIDYGSILGITKAGAGSITATNSFDMGKNTGITITGPTVGGGVVGVIGG